MVKFVMALFFLVLPFLLFAQRGRDDDRNAGPAYKLSESVQLPAVGLKFKVWTDVKSLPITPAQILDATHVVGGKSIPVRVARPIAYTIEKQTLANWNGQSGAVYAYQLKCPCPPPKDADEPQNLDKYMEKATPPFAEAEVLKWIKDYLAIDVSSSDLAKPQKKPNCTIYAVKNFVPQAQDPRFSVFLYWMNCTVKEERTTFLLVYYVLTPSDPALKERLEKDLIKNASQTSFSAAKFVSGKREKRTIGNAKSKNPVYLEKLKKVEKMLANMPGWQCVQAESYILITNSKDKKFVAEIKKDMNECRSVYVAYYPECDSFDNVGIVKIFATREEYLSYVRPEYRSSGGLFDPSTGELLVSGPFSGGKVYEGSAQMKSVLFHEGFHHFISQTVETNQEILCWLNEGCARVFENVIYRSSKPCVELTAKNLNTWMKSVPQSPEALVTRLNQVLKMTKSVFYAQDPLANYDFSGALMYFILKSPAVMKNPYTDIPLIYTRELRKNNPNATDEAWKNVDKLQFAKDMIDFYSDPSKLKRAAQYNPKVK